MRQTRVLKENYLSELISKWQKLTLKLSFSSTLTGQASSLNQPVYHAESLEFCTFEAY